MGKGVRLRKRDKDDGDDVLSMASLFDFGFE